MARLASVCVLFVFAACLSGCGGGSKYPTAPVSGTIKMDGKPLSNGVVTFQPDGPGMASLGTTDESGRYTLKALRGEFDGAVVAKHRVVIRTANTQPIDTTSDRNDPKAAERIPKKYNVETELTIEVPEGGRDDADFNLSSK